MTTKTTTLKSVERPSTGSSTSLRVVIEYKGALFSWRSGDDLADLEALVANLIRAITEAKAPEVVAANSQHPLHVA